MTRFSASLLGSGIGPRLALAVLAVAAVWALAIWALS
jgi:Holliday junction resolvasome RuvABC DNA-binding subunit